MTGFPNTVRSTIRTQAEIDAERLAAFDAQREAVARAISKPGTLSLQPEPHLGHP